jgi:hypothetical protein
MAVMAILDFLVWIIPKTPSWTIYIWISLTVLLIIDWMFGGISDRWI